MFPCPRPKKHPSQDPNGAPFEEPRGTELTDRLEYEIDEPGSAIERLCASAVIVTAEADCSRKAFAVFYHKCLSLTSINTYPSYSLNLVRELHAKDTDYGMAVAAISSASKDLRSATRAAKKTATNICKRAEHLA